MAHPELSAKTLLWSKHPTLVQCLGLCPILVMTNTASNALVLALCTWLVLVISNVLISLIRPLISAHLRLVVFALIHGILVTILGLYLAAYFPIASGELGIFISLIAANCILLVSAQSSSQSLSVWASMKRSFFTGFAFFILMLALGIVRELIGTGQVFAGIENMLGESFTILSIKLFDQGLLIAILPPGALILLGLIIAIKNVLSADTKTNNDSELVDTHARRARVTGRIA